MRFIETLGCKIQYGSHLKNCNDLVSATDFNSVKIVDFGNAIHCIHDELSLYYDDFEFQTLLYRAPEVMLCCHVHVHIHFYIAIMSC